MNVLREVQATSARDIFHWKDPKVSAVVLGICLAVWWVLFCGASNLLTTFCRCLNILFLLGAVHRLGYLDLSKDRLDRYNDNVYNFSRRFIAAFFPLMTWENPAHSAMVVIIIFITAIVAWWFSYSNAVLLLIAYLFGSPSVYKNNKAVIDTQLNKLNDMVNKVFPNPSKSRSAGGATAKAAKDVQDAGRVAAEAILRTGRSLDDVLGIDERPKRD